MINRRFYSVFAAVVTAGALVVMPGCDWLKGSGGGARLSPFLSNLSITPSSVLCGQNFSVSFRYDDPQGDIARALVTLEHGADPAREESPAWPDAFSKSSGTISFPFSFTSCEGKGGVWTIKVVVEDERGHKSNTISGDIRLNAAG